MPLRKSLGKLLKSRSARGIRDKFSFSSELRSSDEELEQRLEPNFDESVEDVVRQRDNYELTKAAWRGRPFISPVDEILKRGAKVLDAGCGVGYMVVDLAKQYPQSRVHGVDVGEGFPTENLPQNASFFVTDKLQTLPFANDTFDFVHMSHVLMFMNASQWYLTLRELVRVLKPGGMIELYESNVDYQPAGPYTTHMNELHGGIFNELGLIRRMVEQLSEVLGAHEQLYDVTVIELDIPLAWGELGDKHRKQLEMSTKSIEPLMLRSFDIAPKKYGELRENVFREAPEYKACARVGRAYATKVPRADWR